MRKLSFKAILLMEGQKVTVHDLEYDAPDQVCEIKFNRVPSKIDKKKTTIESIEFFNDEFLYVYRNNKCENGEFEVYSHEKK